MKHGRLVGLASVAFGLALLCAAPASAATAIPDRGDQPLHDNAGVLTAETRNQVEADLESYYARTGNTLAILLVKTTGGPSIDDFSNDVIGKWGVGQKGKDNGVLLVLAMDDRQGRIEVGGGLEGTLTDIQAAAILNTQIFPRLQAGDPNEAVRAGEVEIRANLGDPEAHSTTSAPQPLKHKTSAGTVVLFILSLIFMFVVFGNMFGLGGRRRGGMFIGGGGFGGFGGGFGGGGSGGGGFGGFGGGDSSGGGASGGW